MGTPAITSPTGTITSPPTALAGSYTRATPTDALGPLELVEIDLTTHETSHAGELTLWTITREIPASGVLSDTFSVGLPAIDWTNRAYCWRFRVRDSSGNWSSWTSRGTFTLSVAAPSLSSQRPTATPVTLLTMTGLRFSAAYSDGAGNPPSRILVELVAQVASEAWDAATYGHSVNLWSHDDVGRDWDGSRITVRYGGPALTEGATYLWRMRAGNRYGALSSYIGGQFALVDRTVPGSGPVETVGDTWEEIWRTNVITRPVGLWYDSNDPGNIRVLDRSSKNLSVVVQADRSLGDVYSLAAVVNYPAGLSGDPANNNIFWILDAPWSQGVSGDSRVKSINRSTLAVVSNFNVGAGQYSSLKVSGNWIYLTNYGTGYIEKYNKSTGALVGSWQITHETVLQTKPTGIMVDGTTLYYFFYNDGSTRRFLTATEANPDVITGTKSTAGTFLLGGEMDTTSHYDMYGDMDTDNLVAKFSLAEIQYSDGTAATRLRYPQTSYGDA